LLIVLINTDPNTYYTQKKWTFLDSEGRKVFQKKKKKKKKPEMKDEEVYYIFLITPIWKIVYLSCLIENKRGNVINNQTYRSKYYSNLSYLQ
jgi:hypothetical protein